MKYDLSGFFAAVDAAKQKEAADDFQEESESPAQDMPQKSARAERPQEAQPDDAADAPVTVRPSVRKPSTRQAVLQNTDAGEPDKIRALYIAELRPFIKADLSGLTFLRLEYLRARITTGNEQNAKILAAAFDKEAERTGSTMKAWTALFS